LAAVISNNDYFEVIVTLDPITEYAPTPTRGQSSHGLDNSRTSQLADSEFFKIMNLLYFICTLNLTLTLTVTLSNIGSV